MKKIPILIFAILLPVQLTSQVLNVNEFIQEKNQWCWAAVTACVLDYYCVPTPQCVIADYTRNVATWHDFGDHDCCGDSAQQCNYWNYNWYYEGSMQDILVHFGDINNSGTMELSMDEIRIEIENNRLFIARWEWNNGNGHFLVGHGLVNNNMYYMDPKYGEGLKIANYDWFRKSSAHIWTHTNIIYSSPERSVAMPADTITGMNIVCKGQDSIIYTTPVIENAADYIWTLPSGASGTSSDTSITVSFSDSASSGKITVKGINDCGEGMESALSIYVRETPDPASVISGKASVCAGEDSVVYTVPAIKHASEYIWTLPEGASGNSNTNTITVFYGDSASTGEISVMGINACERGAGTTMAVTVHSVPLQPTVGIENDLLRSSADSGNQWYDQYGPIEGAVDQEYTPSASGNYYVQVNKSGCISPPSEIVAFSIAGARQNELNEIIQVYPNPFTNELILENKATGEDINFDIVNAKGEIVFRGKLADAVTVETTAFQPGIYIIRLGSGEELEFRKVINK